jgi:hypothetical protein
MNQFEPVQNKIFEIRKQRVMLDFHLAKVYEIETRALKQAVRRNPERFPPDFMFQLTKEEFIELITNCDNLLKAEIKFTPSLPFSFTEQGIAMLSSVLKSPKAIQMNISIMRAFVEFRKYTLGYEELKCRLNNLEVDVNTRFNDIYDIVIEMENERGKHRPVLGFSMPSEQPK